MKKNKKLTVFIIDDNLPTRDDFVSEQVYDREINMDQLRSLVKKGNWRGEGSLLELIKMLLNHEYVKKGYLNIFGFKHPEICLSSIRKNLKPDILIYDWEYGSHQYQKSSNWLFQILNKSKKTFVFVYSGYISEAPHFLNKDDFKPYAKRFQLFLKGEKERSIFSSEEFILQYVLTRIRENNIIKIQGTDIYFTSSGYLKKPKDILYLERILGKSFLISEIKKLGNKINKDNIDKMIKKSEGNVLLSENKKFLIDSDQEYLIESFSAKEKISYLQVVQKYGIKKLLEAIESGLVKVS